MRSCFSLSKNMFFDRLAEVKEAVETNNSNLSAYIGTVRFELCSKSKRLAQQGFSLQGKTHCHAAKNGSQ